MGVLVLLAASRLIKVNVDVLMDRAPLVAEAAARDAIGAIQPAVELRRLRMRSAGGRQFADVVIGVSPSAAVGQGHAAADAVEAAVERALPNADVVVHVEPTEDATVRERAHAAALALPRIREVHNLALVDVDGRTELSLHVKLPGDLSLDEAHEIAEQLEAAICAAVPEIAGVQTHLEPLAEVDGGARGGGRRRGDRAARRAQRRREPSRASCASSARMPGSSRSSRSASRARAASPTRMPARAGSRSRSVASGRTSPT